MAAKKDNKDYIPAVGRRKRAIARVRILTAKAKAIKITINDKDYTQYFPYKEWQDITLKPLKMTGQDAIVISVRVEGGGFKGQAEAVCHGISRALLKMNEEFKATLRKEGLLTRDSRIKERKKPGLRKARRAPQWSKR